MSIYEVNLASLQELAIRIRRRELSFDEAAKHHIVYDTLLGSKVQISKSVSTLKRLFRENNIKVFDIGRKGTTKDISSISGHVLEVYQDVKVGITKTWMILNKKNVKCSRLDVANVFNKLIHPHDAPEKKKIKPRYRYIINKVNGGWHGDIHYITREGNTKYMFALIDDRSRFVVGYGIFDEKTAMNVQNVFAKTINDLQSTPLVFWSDNGKENIAESVKAFLTRNNIDHVRTIPGNPQSNGKIEKFWVAMEKRINEFETWTSLLPNIDKYIYDYNYKIPHSGLEKGEDGFNKIPCEVFKDEELQAKDLDSTTITIDQKGTIPLSVFLHKKSAEDIVVQS